MKLSPTKFNAHLAHMGQRVLWSKSYRCPCTDRATGSPLPSCPRCRGIGFFWVDPVDSVCGVSGMHMRKMWASFGMADLGDVVLTIPSNTPLYAAGHYDRIVMADSSEPFSTTLFHSTTDRLYWSRVDIDRVFWFSGDKTIEGGIPEVQSNGFLSWPDYRSAPPAGKEFSITGRFRPEYFVFTDMPQDRAHHSGLQLPRRIVARRIDLLGRQ